MVSAPVARDRENAFCDERAELQTVLSSPLFQRAPKLSKILAYVCEQYFSGKAAKLKEYSIAVDALGRSPGFDPQTDAIVRVDLHLLRKRLELYYTHEGRQSRVRIVLPPGHYAPEFALHNVARTAQPAAMAKVAPLAEGIMQHSGFAQRSLEWLAALVEKTTSIIHSSGKSQALLRASAGIRRDAALIAALSCGVGFVFGVYGAHMLNAHSITELWTFSGLATPVKAASLGMHQSLSSRTAQRASDEVIRIRCGSPESYVDPAGLQWRADLYYSGGTPFLRKNTLAANAGDAASYETGRQGIFEYNIPVTPGMYEIHLLFRETGVAAQASQPSFAVGRGNTDRTKEHEHSGEAATMKIYYGVHPSSDGKLHIRSESADGFLSALEIVPQAR